ncbi:MAG: hypothetical protein RLY93_01100 [Sumerlaeia bacterium]
MDAPDSPQRKRELFWVLAAVLLGWGAFFPSLFNGFVYDDHNFIVNNPAIRDWGNLWPLISTTAAHSGLGENTPPTMWRPLRNIAFLIDHSIAGYWAPWWHAMNLLWHGIAVAGVYVLARRLGLRALGAFIAAALFAIHPVQTESVVWVKERDGLMSTAMILWGIVFGLGRSWKGAAGGAFLGAAAILTKESGVTFPPLMLLAGGAFALRNRPGKDFVKRIAILIAVTAALAIVFIALRDIVLGGTSQIQGRLGGSLAADLWTDGEVFARYLGLIAWPSKMELVYAHIGPREGGPWLKVLGFALLAATLAGAVWAAVRRRWIVVLGIGWFLVALLPVSNLVPTMQWMAVRFLYLPLAGVALMAGLAFQAAWDRAVIAPRLLGVVAGAVLTALFVVSFVQTFAWRDDMTLWRTAYLTSPHSREVRVNYATYLAGENRWVEVLGVLQDYPFDDVTYERVVDERAFALYGAGLVAAGQPEAARAHLRQGLETYPGSPMIGRVIEQTRKAGSQIQE